MKKLVLAMIAVFALSAVSFANDDHAATSENHDKTGDTKAAKKPATAMTKKKKKEHSK